MLQCCLLCTNIQECERWYCAGSCRHPYWEIISLICTGKLRHSDLRWSLEYSCLCPPDNRVLVTKLDVSFLLSLILPIIYVSWDKKPVYLAFVPLHSPILVLIIANPLDYDKGGSFHSGVGHLSGVTHMVLHKHITNVTFDGSFWLAHKNKAT